jgi:hypothetical protein
LITYLLFIRLAVEGALEILSIDLEDEDSVELSKPAATVPLHRTPKSFSKPQSKDQLKPVEIDLIEQSKPVAITATVSSCRNPKSKSKPKSKDQLKPVAIEPIEQSKPAAIAATVPSRHTGKV